MVAAISPDQDNALSISDSPSHRNRNSAFRQYSQPLDRIGQTPRASQPAANRRTVHRVNRNNDAIGACALCARIARSTRGRAPTSASTEFDRTVSEPRLVCEYDLPPLRTKQQSLILAYCRLST